MMEMHSFHRRAPDLSRSDMQSLLRVVRCRERNTWEPGVMVHVGRSSIYTDGCVTARVADVATPIMRSTACCLSASYVVLKQEATRNQP